MRLSRHARLCNARSGEVGSSRQTSEKNITNPSLLYSLGEHYIRDHEISVSFSIDINRIKLTNDGQVSRDAISAPQLGAAAAELVQTPLFARAPPPTGIILYVRTFALDSWTGIWTISRIIPAAFLTKDRARGPRTPPARSIKLEHFLNPRGWRVFMGGDDRLLSDGSNACSLRML
ncbi:hypothetical protein EVAR_61186_1 [Eumeta japonica]|uniref:Uncharacterized protein n=1 Tax=Eumeta variegata TaxID=151549 RepID=A0A4C1YZA6_EUMVA|nr:hypothetical protein EVAR_61186_1 [Eumeta japonica]